MQPVGTCAVLPPSLDRAAPAVLEDLFNDKEILAWVGAIARRVHRKLPPSFDVEDLEQTALIAHWHCVERYDPSRNDNYRGFAYSTIRGAVLMSCRRRHYREATHEPLAVTDFASATDGGRGWGQTWAKNGSGVTFSSVVPDKRPNPEDQVLVREEQRLLAGSRLYVQRFRLLIAVANLPAEERDVVRRVFAGADIAELDSATPGTKKLLNAAFRRLKRELAPTRRPSLIS